ncbi:hypothetical protein PAECIP111893_01317 [Paenibacillus plantiphilus]|uniref:Uncharacterized protein n=1 Tax=Paenibacillus plantiphilus TaxID=2905650 RepID=A0ABN8G454_9BACL|nr:hypothetical protein [Paenibacillus plantiphilus]CAH1199331.1 hypothetical protein PAECIP111893_01317 [Paenibacillus plantiphilus]
MRKISITMLCLFLLLGIIAVPASAGATGSVVKPVKAMTTGENWIYITFDGQLTATDHGSSSLPSSAFSIGLPDYTVNMATAVGDVVVLMLNKPLIDVDSVDIGMEEGVVENAAGGAHNLAITGYKVVTPQGKLALKETLDPSGSGVTLNGIVKYVKTLPASSNIVGASGIDSEDVRYLLSIMDIGEVNKEELLGAIERMQIFIDGPLGTVEARQELADLAAAAQTLVDNASATQRQVDSKLVELRHGISNFILLYLTNVPQLLPTPISIEPTAGTMLADHLVTEDEISAIQGLHLPASSSDPKFTVTLPKNPSAAGGYAIGDIIHIVLGQSNAEISYTLTVSDIAAINNNLPGNAVFTIDARSFFLDASLEDQSFTPFVFVEKGDHSIASLITVSANPVTIKRRPVIHLHQSTGYVERGTLLGATASKAGMVYLVPAEAVVTSRADLVNHGNSYAPAAAAHASVFLSTTGLLVGESYKLYAIDDADQISAPTAAVTITAAAEHQLNARGTHPDVEVDTIEGETVVYIPAGESMDVGTLKSHLISTRTIKVQRGSDDFTEMDDSELVTSEMAVAVGDGPVEIFNIRTQLPVTAFSGIVEAIDNSDIDAIKLNNNIVASEEILVIYDRQISFRAKSPRMLTVGGVDIGEDDIIEKSNVTVIADVGTDDARLATSVSPSSIADEVRIGTLKENITGPLKRSETHNGVYVNTDNVAVISELFGWEYASGDSSINTIYFAADVTTYIEIVLPVHPLNLFGNGRLLTGYPITGTLNGVFDGVSVEIAIP